MSDEPLDRQTAKPDLIPQPNGGALLPGGMPGNKGNIHAKRTPGTGQKPDAWKQLCRDLVSDTEVLAVAESVLKDKNHPAWLGAFKFVGEQGFGKAKQEVDIGSDSLEALIMESWNRGQARLTAKATLSLPSPE